MRMRILFCRQNNAAQATLPAVLAEAGAHCHRRSVPSDVLLTGEMMIYGGLHHADKLIVARRQKASFNAISNR